MAKKTTTRSGFDTPDPGADVPDPPRQYDSMQVLQLLVEIQKELTSNTTKVDRLISDTAKAGDKVSELERMLIWARGFAVAAVLLIPIMAGIVMWLVGGQLESIRDQLLTPPPAAAGPATPG